MINNPTQHYLAEFNRIAHHLSGKNLLWLKKMRETAVQDFLTRGFPSIQEEDWKYTNVTPIIKENFKFELRAERTQAIPKKNGLTTLPYSQLVFIDGHYSEQLSHIKPQPKGVIVTSLAKQLAKNADTIKDFLGKTIPKHSHGFISLNTAFLNDGVYIYVPSEVELTEPIQLIFFASEIAQNNFFNLRNVIIAEKNSRAIIIEQYKNNSQTKNFTNAVSEISLQKHSKIEHYKLQQENENSFHISTVYTQQAEYSEFTSHSFAFGGLLARSDTHVELNAEHANCELKGLYSTHHRQHIDHHTLIHHKKPHGKSREYYKGVLADRSHAVFNGKVIVEPGAQKTDAQQTNKNLLLSADAEIDTKPQLEIFADDVQCTHGAAVGQLDENSLFYLRSRGLNEQEARNMLIYAFIRELIDTVSWIPLRDYLQQILSHYSAIHENAI